MSAGRAPGLWYERWVHAFPFRRPAGALSPAAVVVVAFGGALGSVARWAVGHVLAADAGSWPWATLVVNVAGCVALGVVAGRLERESLRWLFVVTGVLGGFTTMSAFAVELNQLVDAGRALLALSYLAVSVTAGVGAIVIANRGAAR